MLKRFIAAIFFIYGSTSFAQVEHAGRISVKGEIRDIDHEPVSYAHIQVKSKNEGWVGDYYGKFSIGLLAGDTLLITAVSFHPAVIPIPLNIAGNEYLMQVILQKDTVNLKELVIHPWPSTYSQFKKEFMELDVEDPIANLDLNLPSPEEMRNLAYPEGGIFIPGPIGILYNQFSREARLKRTYAELMKKERADKRYNASIVSRVTGMKNADDIKKFIEFCALQIKFILESTDYELYAAILDCYGEYCKAGEGTNGRGE